MIFSDNMMHAWLFLFIFWVVPIGYYDLIWLARKRAMSAWYLEQTMMHVMLLLNDNEGVWICHPVFCSNNDRFCSYNQYSSDSTWQLCKFHRFWDWDKILYSHHIVMNYNYGMFHSHSLAHSHSLWWCTVRSLGCTNRHELLSLNRFWILSSLIRH